MKELWTKVKGWLRTAWEWVLRLRRVETALEELAEAVQQPGGPQSQAVTDWLEKHKDSKLLKKLKPVVTTVQGNPEIWQVLVRLLAEEEKK